MSEELEVADREAAWQTFLRTPNPPSGYPTMFDLYYAGWQAALATRAPASWWRPISELTDSDVYLFYSPGNPMASNENAQDKYWRADEISQRWPKGRYQYPEAPYTHFMVIGDPLPPAPEPEKEEEK
jgi:hypothetical protein